MKQTKKKSKCIGCGKQFTVNARNQHYCSVECREYERKKDMHRCIKKEKHRKRQKEWRKRKKKSIWESLQTLMTKQRNLDFHMASI